MSGKSHNLVSAVRVTPVSSQLARAAIAIAATSLFAMSAHADTQADARAEAPAPQLTINYTDLDLAREADARQLYARLESASKSVCRNHEGIELRRRQQQRACVAQALSDAVASVDHANVTALYRSDDSMRVAQRGTASQRRS